jgi:hypothetical protein
VQGENLLLNRVVHNRDIRKVMKDSTRTLSLVIHRVRLKKKPE